MPFRQHLSECHSEQMSWEENPETDVRMMLCIKKLLKQGQGLGFTNKYSIRQSAFAKMSTECFIL